MALAVAPSSEAATDDELREQITEELEETFRKQQQEMIQTYKQVQRQSNEKHAIAIKELEAKLAEAEA